MTFIDMSDMTADRQDGIGSGTEAPGQVPLGRTRRSIARKLAVFSALVLAVSVGGYLAMSQPSFRGEAKRTSVLPMAGNDALRGGNELDRLAMPEIDFEFSVSPIPPFNMSSLDVGPAMPKGILEGVDVRDIE